MFERELVALLGATPADVVQLVRQVLDLFENVALNHNWMSNTQLAAIAEAQGAELFRSNGRFADHANSLRQALNSLSNDETEITDGVLRIQRVNRPVGDAIFNVLRPLFEYSRDIRRVGNNTLSQAQELARTAPTRLAGIKFEAGERGRDTSIVRQIAQQAPQLRQRGIDPTLISNASPTAQTVVAEAEALPADEREALIKATPVIVTMRQLIAAQLSAISTVLRAALARVLGPLDVLLDFLARTFGSRLTSFFVIPTQLLKEMLRQAGVQEADVI